MKSVVASLVLFALFINIKALSQARSKDYVEKGKVIDAETTLPVEGAVVVLLSSGISSLANEEGSFWVKSSKREADSIKITAIGYESKIVSYKDFLAVDKIIALKKQLLQLTEVVIAANDYQNKVLSKIDAQLLGINNAQEVLRLVPGLFIGQHAGGGKAEQIFLRGFDIDHGTDINITVDGTPVNMVSHAHGQGYADLHFLIPELIEKVQFDKGPYEAEKGNLATAGFVAFETKIKPQNNFAKIEGGLFNTFRNVNLINLLPKENKNQSLYIASEYLYSKGYFDNSQHLNRLNFFGKYFNNIQNKHTLTISAAHFKSKWNASGQIPERAVKNNLISFYGAIDPNEGGNTERSGINATLKTYLKGNSFLKNQAYLTHYNFTLFSNFTFFLIDSINGDRIKQKEERNVFGYNSSYYRSDYLGNVKSTLETGISIRVDRIRDIELSRVNTKNRTLQPMQLGDINEANLAAYISQTLSLNNKFRINGVLRTDFFKMLYKDGITQKVQGTNAAITSPKLNLFYTVNKNTELYARIGKGFHSNDTRVAVMSTRNKTLPAAHGVDIGVSVKTNSNVLVHTTLWYLQLAEELVYVGDEGIIEPGGKTRRLGADVSIRYQIHPSLFIDVNTNYAHPRNTDVTKREQYVPLAPIITSTGGITYKKMEGFNASLRYRYLGNRPANESNTIIAKGYFIADANVSYTTPKMEVGLCANNLFNTRWKETQFETESRLSFEPEPVREIHFTPGTPFNIKAFVTYRF